MVVGTLANRASLSPSLVETLTVAIASNIQKESAVEGAPLIRVSLMVMIQLMQVIFLLQYCGSTYIAFYLSTLLLGLGD